MALASFESPTAAKTRVLLLLHPGPSDTAEILKGIAHYTRTHGTWSATLENELQTDAPFARLSTQGLAGMIGRNLPARILNEVPPTGFPLVNIEDGVMLPGAATVRLDHAAMGAMAATYFLERKFHSFAYLGDARNAATRTRQHGFAAMLDQHRYRPRVLETDSINRKNEKAILAEWVQNLPPHTAVACCDDRAAVELLDTIRSSRRGLAGDLSVLGMNNELFRCEMAQPSLSSVAGNPFALGYHAAELLDRLIENPSLGQVDYTVAPTGVITRESTHAPAVQDKEVAQALEYIHEHACRGVTVDEVLAHILVSRSKLESRFRRYLGRSPQMEIRKVQVERISNLLLETDLTLDEIAVRTGFVHTEYMSVVFKRLTGEPPGRYRRRHRP